MLLFLLELESYCHKGLTCLCCWGMDGKTVLPGKPQNFPSEIPYISSIDVPDMLEGHLSYKTTLESSCL